MEPPSHPITKRRQSSFDGIFALLVTSFESKADGGFTAVLLNRYRIFFGMGVEDILVTLRTPLLLVRFR